LMKRSGLLAIGEGAWAGSSFSLITTVCAVSIKLQSILNQVQPRDFRQRRGKACVIATTFR
jgi:hypothetical protein